MKNVNKFQSRIGASEITICHKLCISRQEFLMRLPETAFMKSYRTQFFGTCQGV